MVQKLSQFKKAIGAGKRFEIVEHFVKPEHTGEIRKPNVIQTNAFYSVVDGEPENEVSLANGGKGYFYAYRKADCYEFDGETILCKFDNGKPCMKIRFID